MCYVVLNTLFVCSMYDIRILCTFELRYFQLTWCLLPFMSFFLEFLKSIHQQCFTIVQIRPPLRGETQATSESNNEPFDYKRAQQQATSNKQQATSASYCSCSSYTTNSKYLYYWYKVLVVCRTIPQDR